MMHGSRAPSSYPASVNVPAPGIPDGPAPVKRGYVVRAQHRHFRDFTARAVSHTPFVYRRSFFGPWEKTGNYQCQNLGSPPGNAANSTKRLADPSAPKPGGNPPHKTQKTGERPRAFFPKERTLVAARKGLSETHVRPKVAHARVRDAFEWGADTHARDETRTTGWDLLSYRISVKGFFCSSSGSTL